MKAEHNFTISMSQTEVYDLVSDIGAYTVSQADHPSLYAFIMLLKQLLESKK